MCAARRLHALILPLDERLSSVASTGIVGVGRAQAIGEGRLLLLFAEQVALEFQRGVLLQRRGLWPHPHGEGEVEPGHIFGVIDRSGSSQRFRMPCMFCSRSLSSSLAAVAHAVAEERKVLGRVGDCCC